MIEMYNIIAPQSLGGPNRCLVEEYVYNFPIAISVSKGEPKPNEIQVQVKPLNLKS